LQRFLASPGAIEIKKTTPDAFLKTNLEQVLKQLQPDSLAVVGVCTDICVEATARTARYLGYKVEIPQDLVATYDSEVPAPHPGDSSHEQALRRLRDTFGVKVTKA
jgi:nicotinamidase-related amidase